MQRSGLIRFLLALVVSALCGQVLLGAGNPILVLGSGSNAFSSYPSEILRAEGLNAFDTADISTVNSSVLNNYDVVLLGQVALTSGQVTLLTNWVNGGGNLIAFRPDKQLASLMGISDTGTTLSNGYVLVNGAAAPGAGIVTQTMQFHGTADLYSLNGAFAVATLYSTASIPTPYPAVTMRTGIGTGGTAVAFAYDLASSIVFTRQGNPAWVGQARVNQGGPVRAVDMYYGAASFDPAADWIDLSKVAIPQADEQQRLLANLMLFVNQAKKPLPRFWYLPFSKKAAVIMTGDDHGNGGTAGRFDDFVASSPAGCSVADWECVRATSYVYPNTPLTNGQVASYDSQGFEIALHATTGCVDYTAASLESNFSSQLADFASAFSALPQPTTNRTHCLAWSDWISHAQVELNHGIRLDTNYYYWPPSWVASAPGFFNGSGLPMRFAQLNGSIVDVYQAATQMTDESGQAFPATINTLLDNAVGSAGYYGVFTANMHTDFNDGNSRLWADQIVSAALSRGVPVVSSKQMLEWLDGRNGSVFSSIAWSGNTLGFGITPASGSNGLQAMLPSRTPSGALSSITLNGAPVTYRLETIKGIEYAFFTAAAGTYQASYSGSVPPVISALGANPGTTSAIITWTTDKNATSRIDYGTAPDSLTSSISDPALVSAHSISLSNLAVGTTYYYRVTSVDSTGATSTSPVVSASPASFTTIDPTPPIISAVTATPIYGGVATITWTTNKPSNSRVDYGLSSSSLNFNSTNASMVLSHSVTLSGLSAGTTYYYTVTSVDSANNSAVSPQPPSTALSFAQPVGVTVWGPSATPALIDDGDSGAVELGMKFRSDVAGVVTGVRFYKSAANTGTHSGHLWSSNGTLLGTAAFSNETATGWQQANFATPISIASNTTYLVSYYAPNGHYSSSDGFFATSGVDNAPLHALANGVDGGNGVYAYGGASTFPANSYNSSNYWVDVVFTDSVQVVISALQATTTATTATITWTTSVPANSRVDYGTSPSALTLTASDSTLSTAHSVTLTGLTTGTSYYYRVTSVSSSGNTATSPASPSAPATFTPVAPPIISGVTAAPASTTALITWTTDKASTSRIDYGTTPTSLTFSTTDANLVTSHSVNLTGLTAGVNYYFRVTSADSAGATSTSPASPASPLGFATVDLTPPVISAVTATPGLGGTVTVSWTTNENANSRIDYGTSAASLSLTASNTNNVTAHSLTLTGMTAGTTYYYRVTSVDPSGNASTSPATSSAPASFVAVAAVTVWPSTATPSVADSGDSGAAELGMKFRSDLAGVVTAVRFYKAAANTGVHIGNLWSSTGTLLGTVTFSNESASGWQQESFAAPIPIAANTTYIVSYYAPTGHYSLNSAFFASSGVDNAPLHALSEAIDGPNGVYAYSAASAFPNQTFNSSNYWVDVVFAESVAPPIITSVTVTPSPTAAAIAWSTDKLSNSRVDYGTSASNLNLNVADTTMVTAHTINLVGLTTGVTYYYRVTSVDAQGNSTTSPPLTSAAASFVPSAAPQPKSIWTTSATPALTDSNDSAAVELGMKFRSDISGYVTGVRFYKGAANTGVHVGNLWSSSGVRLGTVQFGNETASGWQQTNFSSPIAVAANTTYIISYFAPNGRYSDNENFFSATGVDSPPLHALRDGVDGPNGVYRYSSTSAFPDSTYNSTNYWVDLIFISDDAIPPTVTNFTLPATSSSLVVPITSLTATDNNAVAGYLVTEASTAPSPADSGWTTSPPTSYGFTSSGGKTLYAWAKDGSQNVSASRSASVAITLTDTTAPNVTAFTTPTTSSSLTVPITSLTATDNFAVTGYLVNESATAPSPVAAGWSATVPASYTFTTSGIKTLYAWAKDAAGNVSTSRASSVTIALSSDGPEPAGWYSGDIHVHRSCGGSPESVASLLAKMGVNNLAAISLLADNGNGEVQNPVTDLPLVTGQDDPISTAGRIIHWDVEWHWDAVYTQYPHQALGGHLVALGLNSAQQIWEESTYSILNWARAQNGIAGFAHLQYLPAGIPSSLTCCTPIEYPVEVALGSADFISEDVDDSGSGIAMNPDNFIQAYYKLLNTGFRPGFAAGTDYPCNSSRPLGALLTYAQPAAGQMTYRNWIEAIRNGRTVVSRNGHNEFLNVIVNGTATSGDQVDLASAGSVGVTVQWSTASNMSGTLELVSNGVVVASSPASASQGAPATWNTTINFPKSGWLAARRMGTDGHQVHTAAVFVIVNGAPIRASVDDAQFYVDWMDNLLTKTAPGGEWNSFYPTQLPLAQSRYQQAKALFQQRALEAAGGTTTPTLTSITPASGAPGATVPVTIVGTNLAGATLNLPAGITISGTPGVTATQITTALVVASNATSGALSITVTTSGGTSNAVTFTVSAAAPTLTGTNPTSGARGASIPVTITGTNLLGATLNLPTGITAGGSPAVTATQITATLVISSSATTGARTITATTSGGTSNAVTFTVASAPALTSITPSSGARGATIPVTIVGTNLLGTSLTLPSGITLSGTPTITDTQVTATLVISSSATTGARSISVTNGGSTSNSLTFTVASAPTLTSITPSSGARGATIPVTIVGTNLLGTSLTLPSGITLSGTPTITATQITANLVISSSATTGARSITVTNGGSTSNAVTFTVASAPALTSITPSSGARGATIPVTIVGTNLLGTSLTLPSGITLSGTPTIAATQITANLVISSSATTGARSITATTGGSTSNAVTFTVASAPALTTISPSSGVQGATVPVTIAGTNLIGTSLTLPTGITLSGTPTVTTTQITASLVIASNATTGVRTITVTTGSSTSNSVNFTVNSPNPTLTAISPSSGALGATVPVTITGTNLTGATLNLPSGITLSGTPTVTATQITATLVISTSSATGARSISATTTFGTSNNLTFTVTTAPVITSISPTAISRLTNTTVTINGFNFTPTTTASVSPSSGITVGTRTYVSANQIRFAITVSLLAATGARSLTVTAGSQTSNAATLTIQ